MEAVDEEPVAGPEHPAKEYAVGIPCTPTDRKGLVSEHAPGAACWRASVVLPYEDRRSATAGLAAELRHLVAGDGAAPDWSTFTVTRPQRSTDARGRAWFLYHGSVWAGADALSAAGRGRLAG